MSKFLNAIGFQAGWWACVAGVGHGREFEAMVFCALLAGIHLRCSKHPLHEAQLALVAWIVGVGVDSSLQSLGVIRFHGGSLAPLSPFWLWALWVMFAFTLNASLAFLQKSLGLAALAGLLFGPITYYAGAQLGAASLETSPTHLLGLAVAWMLAMPLLVLAAQRRPAERNGQ